MARAVVDHEGQIGFEVDGRPGELRNGQRLSVGQAGEPLAEPAEGGSHGGARRGDADSVGLPGGEGAAQPHAEALALLGNTEADPGLLDGAVGGEGEQAATGGVVEAADGCGSYE
ncbi:hypothetical protein [Streptomyces sp. NBC_00057]|uniref:hypothetical protein n=1 Tax=Streptomyces sp. NBC_00057 TaxID=2975634 RepID=UPI00324872C1